MARQSFKIEWDAHEHEHKERSSDWFWAVGILTVAIAIAAIIFGNYIFSLFILLSAFSLALFINRHPETIHITVDETGIIKKNIKYPFNTLQSFWIDEKHPHKKIILRSKKILVPLIVVPLGNDVDTDRLRNTLEKYLPLEFHHLPLAEVLLEYLGF